MAIEIKDIVDKYPLEQASLIPILQDIQAAQGFLSEQALTELAQLINISENEIYGLATFYSQFRFHPPGQHTAHVCLGTACHVRGGHQILNEFQQQLGIGAGETTEDGEFDLQRVACLGCCALAPVVVVDGEVHAQISARKVPTLLKKYQGEKNPE